MIVWDEQRLEELVEKMSPWLDELRFYGGVTGFSPLLAQILG